MNAKVLKVLSDYEIVINIGRDGGVEKGDSVRVYAIGDMITDPETGEEYERLEIVRGNGKVTHVQQKISTVLSSETRPAPTKIRRTSGGIAILSGSPSTVEETSPPEPAPFRSPQPGDSVLLFPSRMRVTP